MLHGIDVSNNQGAIDWGKAAAAPVDFAFVKISEGTSFRDDYFAANWAACKARGIPVRGAYHFCHPELNPPEAEAAWFVAQVAPTLLPGDLAVLDCEDGGTTDRGAWLAACAAEVSARLGFAVGIYSDLYYLQRWLQDPRLAAYWLWLAAYGGAMPVCPPPWRVYQIWQYSSKGTIPGVEGDCDLNQAACTVADLLALGKPFPLVSPHAARVRSACALKSLPSRKNPSRVLAMIPKPPGGLCLDLGERHVTEGLEWARIQFRDLIGWVVASNLDSPLAASGGATLSLSAKE